MVPRRGVEFIGLLKDKLEEAKNKAKSLRRSMTLGTYEKQERGAKLVCHPCRPTTWDRCFKVYNPYASTPSPTGTLCSPSPSFTSPSPFHTRRAPAAHCPPPACKPSNGVDGDLRKRHVARAHVLSVPPLVDAFPGDQGLHLLTCLPV